MSVTFRNVQIPTRGSSRWMPQPRLLLTSPVVSALRLGSLDPTGKESRSHQAHNRSDRAVASSANHDGDAYEQQHRTEQKAEDHHGRAQEPSDTKPNQSVRRAVCLGLASRRN